SPDGAYIARSRSSRASSTPRLEAASISTTSRLDDPLQMRSQETQTPHGSPSAPRFSQLSAIASTRASGVLPTPRGPQSRYPCATRPRAMAPLSVAETCDCTATSLKRFGRYLRARAIICGGRDAGCGARRRNLPRRTEAIEQTTRAGMLLDEQSSPREYPRPTEATKDTSCRCYLRGPDGVRRLSPSGTWDTGNIVDWSGPGSLR